LGRILGLGFRRSGPAALGSWAAGTRRAVSALFKVPAHPFAKFFAIQLAVVVSIKSVEHFALSLTLSTDSLLHCLVRRSTFLLIKRAVAVEVEFLKWRPTATIGPARRPAGL
jgi:hypothetical protein